jgi:membrane-associated phospholipid phosphatase
MFTNIPGDWVRFGGQTFRLEALPAIGSTALATGLLYALDRESYNATHDAISSSRFSRSSADVLAFTGDGRLTLGLAGIFALHGFVWKDDRSLRVASQTVEALLASGIVVQILKRVSGRESPQVASSPRGAWRPFPSLRGYNANQPRYYAFPSGHVTTAMATLTVLTENYPDQTWMRPAGYVIIGLAGVSLVSKGWHWYSDFPLAVALGYSFGMIAAHRDDQAAEGSVGDTGSRFRLFPLAGIRGTGAMLAYQL